MARKVEPGSEPAAGQRVPFHRYFRYFLGLGTWGFGGPIATVGYMQRDLVEGRDWVSRRDFLDGVALGQTMPGPLAAQVAMWVGYLQAGAVGALGTAIPFILPSLAIVLGVAYLYVRFQGLTVVQSLFYGIAPAVMAIIAFAAVKLARLTNSKDIRLWVISAAIMAVTALTGAFIFGSGLAIVPFLREGVVNQHHWLTERQFLDAVAIGLITPGPVVITA